MPEQPIEPPFNSVQIINCRSSGPGFEWTPSTCAGWWWFWAPLPLESVHVMLTERYDGSLLGIIPDSGGRRTSAS